jgi:hypothetical protein
MYYFSLSEQAWAAALLSMASYIAAPSESPQK